MASESLDYKQCKMTKCTFSCEYLSFSDDHSGRSPASYGREATRSSVFDIKVHFDRTHRATLVEY